MSINDNEANMKDYSTQDDGGECDLGDCGEERVIAVSTCGEKCVIDDPYSAVYHSLMFPTAKQVSLMFPAAMVSAMFPANQDTMTPPMSMTTSTSSVSMMSSNSSELMTSSITSDSNSTVEWIYVKYWDMEEEDLTTKLIKFINIAAPGALFSPAKSRRRRRKKIMKFVHPEMRTIFQHSLVLFSPTSSTPEADPRPSVPLVDWSRVNNRSLGNLPTPQMFPKLGCSEDPNIYAERIRDHGAHGRISSGSIHAKERFPFGLEYGLMTDLGVISTNKGDQMDDPYKHIVNGYVWSRELSCWVIHARYPKDNLNNNTKKVKEGGRIPRKPKKRAESR